MRIKKTSRVAARVTEDLKRRAEQAAAVRNTTLSALIVTFLTRLVKADEEKQQVRDE